VKRAVPRLPRLGGLALGVALGLSTSGCVAAGLAGGPLMSAVQVVSDRTVERTVGADLAEAQGVTEAVLTRMAFRIEDRQRGDGIRRLRGVADDVTAHVRLERVTAKLTRVGVRVERGRLLADRDTGAQIHEQIAALLTPATVPTAASDPAAAEAFSAVQAELHRLRSDLESRRAERPIPLRESGTAVRVEPGGVVSIPLSAALPTVGGPAPPVSVPLPATAPTISDGPAASPPPAARPATLPDSVARPLHPAGALTPIQAAIGAGSDK
jgi:hypothetical protein